jgi:hypothetical protein
VIFRNEKNHIGAIRKIYAPSLKAWKLNLECLITKRPNSCRCEKAKLRTVEKRTVTRRVKEIDEIKELAIMHLCVSNSESEKKCDQH